MIHITHDEIVTTAWAVLALGPFTIGMLAGRGLGRRGRCDECYEEGRDDERDAARTEVDRGGDSEPRQDPGSGPTRRREASTLADLRVADLGPRADEIGRLLDDDPHNERDQATRAAFGPADYVTGGWDGPDPLDDLYSYANGSVPEFDSAWAAKVYDDFHGDRDPYEWMRELQAR